MQNLQYIHRLKLNANCGYNLQRRFWQWNGVSLNVLVPSGDEGGQRLQVEFVQLVAVHSTQAETGKKFNSFNQVQIRHFQDRSTRKSVRLYYFQLKN